MKCYQKIIDDGFWLILIIVIVTMIGAVYYREPLTETLKETFSQFMGYECPSCWNKTRSMCSYYCENCGFCVQKDGTGRCVPGDASGPYYDKCHIWEHSDAFSKYIWKNR